MTELKIDGVRYPLADTFAELPYHRWAAAQKASNLIDMTAALSGVPEDLLRQMEYTFVAKLNLHFKWLDNTPTVPLESFVFEGVRYSYDNRFHAITAAQFADLEEAIKQYAGDEMAAYPRITSILYKPDGKYDSTAAEAAAVRFQQLPMDIVAGISVFFSIRENNFSKAMQAYSRILGFQTRTKPPKNGSPKTGGILMRSWKSVKRMAGRWNTSRT